MFLWKQPSLNLVTALFPIVLIYTSPLRDVRQWICVHGLHWLYHACGGKAFGGQLQHQLDGNTL